MTPHPNEAKLNEDKRRPKALKPYLTLWAIMVVCVVFALIGLYNLS
jgi:hypothetical protein